ncbi:MAG: hypothetical protein ACTSX4_10450 [Candidatus Helarchaeota archaeon]
MAKKFVFFIFLILFLFLLIPLGLPSTNYKKSIYFNLNPLDQATANGNITEAEVAIQGAYSTLVQAENLGIDISSLSNDLELAIEKLNLAIELNNSQNPNFQMIEGNASLAKNIASGVNNNAIQLINSAIVISVVMIVIVLISISSGISIILHFYYKRIKPKKEREFLDLIVKKKEDAKLGTE